MSTDPYNIVQSEIQTALQSASALRASFRRIRSTAREDSEELGYARSELKATLSALEADLDDLEESVKIVEETGPRMFGLDDTEVIKRRQYVQHVRNELESIRSELASGESQSSSKRSSMRPINGRDRVEEISGTEDDQAAWSKEEQQMLVQEQDRTLSTISGTLTTLAAQAGLIGREVGEHNEMLTDLEANVDHTDSKLNSAMQRMRKFIWDTEETKSGWCIGILIVILCILLLVVILV